VLRWFFGFLFRYFLFSLAVIGAARAYSWLYGYDDEVKVWASQNRLAITLFLVLAAIIYAMYDWLDHEDDR
jgi:hypothetical protein